MSNKSKPFKVIYWSIFKHLLALSMIPIVSANVSKGTKTVNKITKNSEGKEGGVKKDKAVVKSDKVVEQKQNKDKAVVKSDKVVEQKQNKDKAVVKSDKVVEQKQNGKTDKPKAVASTAKPVSKKKKQEIDDGEIEETKHAGSQGSIVLHQQKITLEAGKSVALVGPTGCGKSTLISLIMRMYDLVHGSIKIDGIDIKDCTYASLREVIAYCPQSPTCFKLRTLRDNIRYGCEDATDDEVVRAAKLADFHSVTEKLPKGYDTRLGPDGKNLSGGQFQRLALARAFLRILKGRAIIAIFDEATSALDSETEVFVMKNLKRLLKKKRITSITIAHRLSTISWVDRILVLKNGKVIEDGSHEELLAKKGDYYKLWQLSTRSGKDDDSDDDEEGDVEIDREKLVSSIIAQNTKPDMVSNQTQSAVAN